ncbi:MAG: hypothetical protein ABEK12_00055, partial [Candidatus Nanohaloarchaea archaeon]
MRRLLPVLMVLALVPAATAGTPQVTLDSGGGQGCRFGSADYALTLTNPGPASDTYTVHIDPPWVGTASFSERTVTVANGSSTTVYFWIRVPGPRTATPGTYDVPVRVTRSNGDDVVARTGTLQVLSCQAVEATVVARAAPMCRGGTTSATVRVRNTGQVRDTYTITAPRGTVDTGRVTLPPGAARNITVTFSSDTVENTTVPVTVASTQTHASDTATVQVIGRRCRAVTVTAGDVARCVDRTARLNATVTNNGTVRDTYTVTIGDETRRVTLPPATERTLHRPVTVTAGTRTVPV